jgi:flagellar motor switch protein FliG
VPSKGIRKAAALLMSLDAATAAELLGTASPDLVKQIATEMTYLQASGGAGQPVPLELAQEFCDRLRQGGAAGPDGDFVKRLLASVIGEKESQQVMDELSDLVRARDPFLPLRSARTQDLARALEGESPQAVAVVLSELPAERSGQLLSLLPEDLRIGAVCGMTSPESASAEARLRIASVVRERLGDLEGGAGAAAPARQDAKLRKVAVLLRRLEPEARDSLLGAIGRKDSETGEAVKGLMVIWEDLPDVADRSLQEVLREVDARQMALALSEADEATNAKLRANISERAGAMLDEELSLLASPSKDDVQQAREGILARLREMNAKGELNFEGD